MHALELESHFGTLKHDREGFERLLDILAHITHLGHALNMGRALRDTPAQIWQTRQFVSIQRIYRNHLTKHHGLHPEMKAAVELRGRLGGASRVLYAHQRPTFLLAIDIILSVGAELTGPFAPFTWTAVLVAKGTGAESALKERLWLKFKDAERHWLAEARRDQFLKARPA